jgi:SAM-dependent methyltransferase
MSSELKQLYSCDYQQWKKWERLFECDALQQRYYEHEFSGIDFSGKRLLEIGFGDGSLLRWVKDQKAQVVGCELIEPLCFSGKEQGYDTRLGDVRMTVDPVRESFDLVVAFDVLEHVPPNELLDFIQFIRSVMKPGALFMVRVPNGQSPFGLINQYGDITHINVLSKGRFEQLAPMVELEMLYCRNAFRLGTSGNRLIDALRFKLRDGVNAFIAKVYGLGRTPLDPNIVACFRRSVDSRQPG